MTSRPLGLLLLAVALMVAAIVLAFVMVLRVVQPTLFLSFLSFGLTMTGVILGFIGTAQYLGPRQRDDDQTPP